MNWQLLGHEWAIQILQQHAAQNTQRHAYLFTGPESVGRRSLALRFAQALNCPQGSESGEPCLSCKTCQQLGGMMHPDLAIVEAEKLGGVIKVDQIRELQRGLALSPYDAKYRIALLIRFEEANQFASNALLKTLEEPPPQVVILITAESAERLLPTIVSRCELIRLRPVPIPVIEQGLQTTFDVLPDKAHLLAHISGGRPGYAVRLHQEPDLMSQRLLWLQDLQAILAANRVERFTYAASLTKDSQNLWETLKVWLSFWRDVMLTISNSSMQITNIDQQESVLDLAGKIELSKARDIVTSLEGLFALLSRNINARLAVEVFLLDLPYVNPA
jgi:DNA polymerase-3 subunit delta'